MISIRTEIEARGILLTAGNRAAGIYRQEVIRGGVEATELALTKVVQATPLGESGTLWRGWDKRLSPGVPFRAEVFNPVPYGEIVEKGSRPHEIRPRRKKALAFIPGGGPGRTTWAERLGSGKTVFAKRVRHPGTRPRRFVEKTVGDLQGSGSPMWRLWERVIDRIVKELS